MTDTTKPCAFVNRHRPALWAIAAMLLGVTGLIWPFRYPGGVVTAVLLLLASLFAANMVRVELRKRDREVTS